MNKFRYEIKFVLDEVELTEVNQFINKMGIPLAYPSRQINSLYFDNIDYRCIKENLAGISNRHKIRLRWYNEKRKSRIPELEIKFRNGRLGSKEKFKLKNLSIREIETETINKINSNIHNYLYKKCKPSVYTYDHYFPVLYVNYTRNYFQTNSGIRMTIDKKINFRGVTKYSKINYQRRYDYNQYVMELKFSIDQKNEVSDLIRRLRLIPKRHSKYLVGVSKLGLSLYI